jgi:hypothetical protein
VTEAEWATGMDPLRMLQALRGRASERKLRLLAAACCRRVWNLLTDPRSRKAVEFVEAQADGPVLHELSKAVESGAHAVASAPDPARLAEGHAAQAAAYAAYGTHYPFLAARRVLHEAACAAGSAGEAAAQAALLRCIFGDPFRPTSVHPDCLSPAVRQLARALYEERRFGEMPVLADALEEAGCTNQAILAHCRSPGPHVRGCWVLDDILVGRVPQG